MLAVTRPEQDTVRNSLAWSIKSKGASAEKSHAIVSTFAVAAFAALAHSTSIIPTLAAQDFGRRMLVQSQAARPDYQLISKIRSFATYQQGWDGYDGVPATNLAVHEATAFIKGLTTENERVPLPVSTLTGEGEIILLWKNKPFYLSISFWGDGNYSYYAEDAEGREYFNDDARVADPLPREIRNLIL